jgi:hypothetical protein
MEENNQDPIRKSIEDLLREDSTQGLPAQSVGLPAFLPSEPMDYDELKTSSMTKSKKVMGSLLKFYLSQELIDKNEYIRAKANLEITTLSSLIQQMEMSERAITILMRSIDTGETSPRMFEVLGGLQKTLLDIMKHQTLHMMAAEENMKKMRRDIDIYQNTINTTTAKIEQQGTQTSRGTRNLMREIQAELGNEEPEVDPYDFDSEEQNEI